MWDPHLLSASNFSVFSYIPYDEKCLTGFLSIYTRSLFQFLLSSREFESCLHPSSSYLPVMLSCSSSCSYCLDVCDPEYCSKQQLFDCHGTVSFFHLVRMLLITFVWIPFKIIRGYCVPQNVLYFFTWSTGLLNILSDCSFTFAAICWRTLPLKK